MIRLPRGVTGLYLGRDGKPERQVPFADFKAVIHSAARACGYAVRSVHDYEYPRNYYYARLARGPIGRMIFCNIPYGFLAVTANEDHSVRPLATIDDPDLAANLAAVSVWPVLTSAELTARFRPEEHPEMDSPDDRYHITYWKPETVGDVIFNWWD